MACIENGVEVEEYRNCLDPPVHQSLVNVFTFQILMAVIGGLALWGVQIRKKYSMSLFDSRKMRLPIPYSPPSNIFGYRTGASR